ncbi:MAG: hypothetical protein JSU06_11715 [Actinobacteria bacterium]|nr:hypothetical protein [Actinomycetota bacterium]
MLAITDDAATAIDELLNAREMPEEAGVRISTDFGLPGDGAGGPTLRLEIAPKPEAEDQVLGGAHVFIESETAQLLDEKLLDAERSGDALQFTLRDQ